MMWDFLSFRRMLTPVLIQVLFWLVLAYCLYTGIYDLASHRGLIPSLQTLILLPVLARIASEVLILFFRINETLTDIKHNTDSNKE